MDCIATHYTHMHQHPIEEADHHPDYINHHTIKFKKPIVVLSAESMAKHLGNERMAATAGFLGEWTGPFALWNKNGKYLGTIDIQTRMVFEGKWVKHA